MFPVLTEDTLIITEQCHIGCTSNLLAVSHTQCDPAAQKTIEAHRQPEYEPSPSLPKVGRSFGWRHDVLLLTDSNFRCNRDCEAVQRKDSQTILPPVSYDKRGRWGQRLTPGHHGFLVYLCPPTPSWQQLSLT